MRVTIINNPMAESYELSYVSPFVDDIVRRYAKISHDDFSVAGRLKADGYFPLLSQREVSRIVEDYRE